MREHRTIPCYCIPTQRTPKPKLKPNPPDRLHLIPYCTHSIVHTTNPTHPISYSLSSGRLTELIPDVLEYQLSADLRTVCVLLDQVRA